jgi:aminoglycoside phosphotransferase (APT) family kinase protein
MNTALSDPQLQLAWQTPIVNGLPCPEGAEIAAELPDTLRSHGLLDPASFSFLHGDYCMSNLLYDRRNRIVRTIDPRGRFGDVRFYGDPLYDEAKLAHSFHGDYDFLVHGAMRMTVTPEEAMLEPTFRATHVDVKELFDDWQRDRLREDFRAVRLIEALLFLSMVPLHADRPESQQAFVLRGRELYARATRGDA